MSASAARANRYRVDGVQTVAKRATRIVTAALLLIGALSSGCATQADNPATRAQLEPAGWVDVASSLAGDDFDAYRADVRQRLADHRVPHDPARASLELERAAPVERRPVARCGERVRGIALLVHGFSDTAWTMRDLAEVFAETCYVARTVLLPGHGTRAGDLLVVNHDDWTDTVRHLVGQAAREHERVVLVGFSLGAVVTTTVALDEQSPVDALIAISPAYYISTWDYARLAPWVHWLYRWIDKGQAADPLRYEAMPTRGVAELVHAMRTLHHRIDEHDRLEHPVMLVQSLDDRATVPVSNQAFVLARASHRHTRVLNFHSGDRPVDHDDDRVRWIDARSDRYRVDGLTHLAVHIAPDNAHYGAGGDYRHCGTADGRDPQAARRCVDAEGVMYTDWGKLADTPTSAPTALSSFNPRFDELERAIERFLGDLESP